MAKVKVDSAKRFDGEVTSFADPVGPSGPEQRIAETGDVEFVRGHGLQADIEEIRTRRAAERVLRGKAGKRRKITNYVDAERLRNLHAAGHAHLITNEELVDCEENGFFDLTGIQTGAVPVLGPDAVPNGTIAPPQAPVPDEDE
jgi:hypothetical protein